MKKKLYTQTSILSETPVGTPENVQPIISQHLRPPMKKAKTRTKIIKKGSLLIAKQPSPASQASKENVSHNLLFCNGVCNGVCNGGLISLT